MDERAGHQTWFTDESSVGWDDRSSRCASAFLDLESLPSSLNTHPHQLLAPDGSSAFLLSRSNSFTTATSTIPATDSIFGITNLPTNSVQPRLRHADSGFLIMDDPSDSGECGSDYAHSNIAGDLMYSRRPHDHYRPVSSQSHLLAWRNSSHSILDEESDRGQRQADTFAPLPSLEETPQSSFHITKEEFEALPPTIQRKCFTTLERHRLTNGTHNDANDLYHASLRSSQPSSHPPQTSYRLRRQRRLPRSISKHLVSSVTTSITHRRGALPEVPVNDIYFYTSLPDKIRRLHLTEEEQLLARLHTSPSTRNPRYRSRSLDSLASSDEAILSTQNMSTLFTEATRPKPTELSETEVDINSDPIYESLQVLEHGEGLDLRLYLDEYHMNLREEVPVPNKSKYPTFRRHMSISRLPFSRSSTSYGSLNAREMAMSPLSTMSTPGDMLRGHSRKKSKALSIISPTLQTSPESSPTIDPAASHYRNPEARKTLRACLATPKDFDEALEYGFPSVAEGHPDEPRSPYHLDCVLDDGDDVGKWHTFFEDDQTSSVSDGVTVTESEWPKTPDAVERPTSPPASMDLSQAFKPRPLRRQLSSASRDMTMRMTLTRPDLRSDEDNIYGWQKGHVGLKSHSRTGSLSPMLSIREATTPQEEMEKRFAAFDEEFNMEPDNGLVKRFWNRVRRN